MIIGKPGSGKSALAELFAIMAKRRGHLVWDLFDSGDYENLYWSIQGEDQQFKPHPFWEKPITIPGGRFRHLVITPKYVELGGVGREKWLAYVPDNTDLVDIAKKAIEEERVISLGISFYDKRKGDGLKWLARALEDLPDLNRDKIKHSMVNLSQNSPIHHD